MSPALHQPILVPEIISFLEGIPQGVRRYYDGTLGRGGHLRAVLERFPDARAWATDKDIDSISYAGSAFAREVSSGRVQVVHSDFKEFTQKLKEDGAESLRFDAILLDLGVSSPQLDTPERGFSFLHAGPLDMRMNQQQGLSASSLVNEATEEDLIQIFKEYGEVQSPGRVVRAILADRQVKPFSSTDQLAALIARIEGWKKSGYHPATQYFMALRIKVNGELEGLASVMRDLISLLEDNGRLLVLTFHSLEDRIVKRVFQESEDLGRALNKRVVTAGASELRENPRARSAKLRVFERLTGGAPVRAKKDKYAHKKGH